MLARPRLRETRPDAPSVRGVVSVAVPDANVTINRDIGAAQVVTKDSQTGFTVYADVAAAKELVNLVKGVAGDSEAAKSSVILSGVKEIGKDFDGDDTTRSDISQDIRNAATDIKTRQTKADADRAQVIAIKSANGDDDKINDATEKRLVVATEAETVRLEQRTIDTLVDQLPASLTPEARAAEVIRIAAEVKGSVRSDATQATIRRQIIVRDTFDADKHIGRGQALSSVDLARLNAAPTPKFLALVDPTRLLLLAIGMMRPAYKMPSLV